MKISENNKLFLFGEILILFIFNIIFVTSLLFLFKISITFFNGIFSFILTLVEYFLIMKKSNYSTKSQLKYIFFVIIVLGFSFITSSFLHDSSWDGAAYHKVAIGQMKSGWNPVYENIEDFNASDENDITVKETHGIWTNHYAKGYWMYAATIYKLTNNIETGKSLTIITIIATLLIAYTFINKFLSKNISLILGILLAFHPVVLYQIPTYYNDGVLGNFVILLLISLMNFLDINLKYKKENFLLLFLSLCILINIKFTGFAYAGIYSILFYIYILFNKVQRKNNLKSITIIGIIALIFATCILGASTYPKNYIQHGHPFYPLYGKDKVDIMEANTPAGLYEMNSLKRFIISNLSITYSANNGGNPQYKIKIPFTFDSSELENFRLYDTRVAGYGVMFGGILIISFISGIYVLIIFMKNRKNNFPFLLSIGGTILIIFLMKESWWARYLPQLYVLPILVIIMLKTFKYNKITNMLAAFLTITLIINSYLIFNYQFIEITHQEKINNKQIKYIKSIPQKTKLLVETSSLANDNPMFDGSVYNLHDIHPNIKVIDPIDDIKGYKKFSFLSDTERLHIFVKEK